jgi:hypothetical protein
VPLSPARDEFRRLVAAKRQYRARRAAPPAVAWRYARELLDVLWYSRDELSSRIVLGAGALVVLGGPLLLIVFVVTHLGGAK